MLSYNVVQLCYPGGFRLVVCSIVTFMCGTLRIAAADSVEDLRMLAENNEIFICRQINEMLLNKNVRLKKLMQIEGIYFRRMRVVFSSQVQNAVLACAVISTYLFQVSSSNFIQDPAPNRPIHLSSWKCRRRVLALMCRNCQLVSNKALTAAGASWMAAPGG